MNFDLSQTNEVHRVKSYYMYFGEVGSLTLVKEHIMSFHF